MLTVAARKAITELATRILADKLVPAEVLALIPAHMPLVIAKKYPGNAEGAQAELMQEALECARRGEIVVRVSRSSRCRLTSYFTPCSEVKTRRSFPVRPRGRRGSFLQETRFRTPRDTRRVVCTSRTELRRNSRHPTGSSRIPRHLHRGRPRRKIRLPPILLAVSNACHPHGSRSPLLYTLTSAETRLPKLCPHCHCRARLEPRSTFDCGYVGRDRACIGVKRSW